jgi:hypothetical protein
MPRKMRYGLIGALQRLLVEGEKVSKKKSWPVSNSTKHRLDFVNSIAFLTLVPK